MIEITKPRQARMLVDGKQREVWYVLIKRNGEDVYRIVEEDKSELEIKLQ